MNEDDEIELKRVCSLLESIQIQNSLSSSQIEALRKSAFALHISFLAGQRVQIEALNEDRPFSAEELNKLRSYGIIPEQ